MATTAQININVNATQAENSVFNLNKDLKATEKELDRIIKVFGDNSKEADKFRTKLANLEVEIYKLGGTTDDAAKSQTSLKTELRKVTQELQGLEPGSKRFVELSQRAGQLKDTIQDTSAVIKATAGNITENFGKALGNSVQIGVAGFQGLMAAQTLFGIENEDLQKTIAKMTALLNLSQALTTFGGLSDKLTEIKAGFTPILQALGLLQVKQTQVATATVLADAALVGESVSAGGAAVSTGFFAAALNALPLIAVVTALGLLVAGLINYATSTDEAAEKEKKRKEELEKSKKAQEEYNAAVKASSDLFASQISGFVSLTAQIKASLPGSKERLSLIKQSNATYGTTIQNLKDEKLFQDKVTKAVSDYIAFARVKFRLQANEKAIEAEFSKQETTITKLAGSLGSLNTAQKQYILGFARQVQAGKEVVGNLNILDAGFLQQGKQFAILQDDVFNYLGSIRISNNVIEGYGSTINELNKEINSTSNALFNAADAGDKHTDGIKDNIDAVDDYGDALSSIKKIQEEGQRSETELLKERIERGDRTIDIVQREKQIKLDEIKVVYEATKININKTVTDKKKQTELLKNLEDAYTEFTKNEGERRRELDIYNAEQRVKTNVETLKLLRLEENALQTEIRFGDGDTNDTLKALSNQRLQNELDNIDSRLKFEQLSVKEFEKLQNDKLVIEKVFLENKAKIGSEVADAEYYRQLEINRKRLVDDNKLNEVAVLDAETQKISYIITLRQELLDEVKSLNDAAAIATEKGDLELAEKLKTNATTLATQQEQIRLGVEKDINKGSENLYEEYLVTKETADTEYFNGLIEATAKTDEEILNNRIGKIEDVLEQITIIYNGFEAAITDVAELGALQRTGFLNDEYQKRDDMLSSSLAQGLISQKEFDNKTKQADEQQANEERALAKKSFNLNKAFSMASATLDGVKAVLSTFANTPGGLVIKGIAATLAGVFSAIQIGVIGSTTFQAATGGIVPGNGSGQIDSVSAQLAPGESVINSASTSRFLPVLSAINQAGGGKSLMPNLPASNQGQVFQLVYPKNEQSQPVRAYVVESDITDAQRRVQRIENSTRF